MRQVDWATFKKLSYCEYFKEFPSIFLDKRNNDCTSTRQTNVHTGALTQVEYLTPMHMLHANDNTQKIRTEFLPSECKKNFKIQW